MRTGTALGVAAALIIAILIASLYTYMAPLRPVSTVTATTTLLSTVTTTSTVFVNTATEAATPCQCNAVTTRTITVTKIVGASTPTKPSGGGATSPSSSVSMEGNTSMGIKVFGSYEELEAYLKRISLEVSQVTAGATAPIPVTVTTIPVATPAPVVVKVAERLSSRPSAVSGAAPTYSTTNVQVPGIDEADIVKSDGRYIYVARVSRGEVAIVRAYPAEGMEVVSRIAIGKGLFIKGLYVVNNTLVVIAANPIYRILIYPPPPFHTNTTVLLYDITNRSAPKRLLSYVVTGSYLSSRLYGRYLYLVTTTPAGIYRDRPIVPMINGTPIPPQNIAAVGEGGKSYTTILALDIVSGRYGVYAYLTDRGAWLYMAPGRIYVVTPPLYHRVFIAVLETVVEKGLVPPDVATEVREALGQGDIGTAIQVLRNYLGTLDDKKIEWINTVLKKYPLYEESAVYLFNVDGLSIEPVFRAVLRGRVLDQFAMEELGSKYFVVATTTSKLYGAVKVVTIRPPMPVPQRGVATVIVVSGGKTVTRTITLPPPTTATPPETAPKRIIIITTLRSPSENNVYVFKLPDLKLVAKLEGLAKGERVYAARLVGRYLFLVTFRRIDPLFAIDLSNPEKPRVLGFLEMPGYSEYLHPIGRDLLIGIGVDTKSRGVKVSLIDVSNPRDMKELARVVIPHSYTEALGDHHAVLVDLSRGVLAIPINLWRGGSGVAVVKFTNTSLDLAALLNHPGASRALYIDNVFYTVSQDLVKAYSYTDFKPLEQVVIK